ncbi:MAG: carbohydrate binding family 9 domain-containing protein [Flavobacteriaceae bacterium]
MKKGVFLLMFVFVKFHIQAQSELGVGKIIFSDSSIQLDGELNESIWNNLVPEGGFLNYIPNNGDVASNKTEVKMFHNGKNLYISAVYHDTIPRVQIGSLKRDDIGVSGAESDSFAIILDTYNQQQSGYFFIVNMGGALIDALVARRGDGFGVSTSWNTIWNARISVKGNLKIFEIEIPLKAIGYKAENSNWGVMFHTRNIKLNEWTVSTPIDRNYSQFDLRFTKTFEVENLSENKSSRFAVTPSVTMNYSEDVVNDVKDVMIKPSLDLQFNVSSSLKLDATINPDFSQIDVDRQVTNLSRFSVFFPERRNFFLENSDLFTSLGVRGVNPFYSRRIGADSEISFGLKLSGNIAKKTRLGVLNVATKAKDDIAAQNYGALVVQQQLSKSFTATGFLINRQETDGFSFRDNYNRIIGVNLNYQSKNNKWTGLANVAGSATNNVSGDNNFYNAEVWYNNINVSGYAGIRKVEKNYITDVGFVPRLYNYDAISESIIREGYTQASGRFTLAKFYKDSKIIDNHRYFNLYNETYWDDLGDISQVTVGVNNDLVFKNQSFLYGGFRHEYVNLKYAFDPLNNGNAIQVGEYKYFDAGLGYASADNKKFQYGGNMSYGTYYDGHKGQMSVNVQYRLMPLARLQVRYERNRIDLNELGNETFHLARFTGEVFFSNRLNWTTYVQYNTQFDNFNINSRLQWEYKPLSYFYLVVSDNYTQDIARQNWGIAFKMNYRFDF